MSDRISEFAREIYRDMRDRNMLIPAIGLVVAIIAVPLLLGGGSSAPPTPVAPSVDTAPASMTGSEEVDPVVLAEVPGLRNYRERLDEFGARNPFKQQMTGGSGSGNDSSTDEASSGGSGAASAGSSSSSSASSSSSSSSTTTDNPSSVPTDDGDSGSGDGKGDTKVVQIQIDVRVGRPGKAKVLTGVKSLDFLPGDERPIVQYVEGDFAATKAAFVVSPKVVSTEGDGNCDPGRNDCQFLLMKKGDEQFFEYGDKAKVYKLQLLAIHRVEVDVKDVKDLGRDARKTSDAAAQFVAQMTG